MAPSSKRHYRVPSKPLLTAWARHLDAVMRERDLSQTNVFDEVREELGYAPTSRSALLRVFSDRNPDATQAAVLARHFGQPPAIEAPTEAELSLQERAVLAAERQAAAAEEQTGLLRAILDALTPSSPWSPEEMSQLREMMSTATRSGSLPRASRQGTPTG